MSDSEESDIVTPLPSSITISESTGSATEASNITIAESTGSAANYDLPEIVEIYNPEHQNTESSEKIDDWDSASIKTSRIPRTPTSTRRYSAITIPQATALKSSYASPRTVNYNTLNYESDFRVVKKKYLASRLDYNNKASVMAKMRSQLISLHTKICAALGKELPIDYDIREIKRYLSKKKDGVKEPATHENIIDEIDLLNEFFDREEKECQQKIKDCAHCDSKSNFKAGELRIQAANDFVKDKLVELQEKIEEVHRQNVDDKQMQEKLLEAAEKRAAGLDAKIAELTVALEITRRECAAETQKVEASKETNKQITQLKMRVKQQAEKEKTMKAQVGSMEKEKLESGRRMLELQMKVTDNKERLANITMRENNLKKMVQNGEKTLMEEVDKLKAELKESEKKISLLEEEKKLRTCGGDGDNEGGDVTASQIPTLRKQMEELAAATAAAESMAQEKEEDLEKREAELQEREDRLLRHGNLLQLRNQLLEMLQERERSNPDALSHQARPAIRSEVPKKPKKSKKKVAVKRSSCSIFKTMILSLLIFLIPLFIYYHFYF